jgi:hypothetical protein
MVPVEICLERTNTPGNSSPHDSIISHRRERAALSGPRKTPKYSVALAPAGLGCVHMNFILKKTVETSREAAKECISRREPWVKSEGETSPGRGERNILIHVPDFRRVEELFLSIRLNLRRSEANYFFPNSFNSPRDLLKLRTRCVKYTP